MENYNLIVRNLEEVVGDENEIKSILEKRPLKIHWGTAPTGRIHIGYFVPLLKIADFLKAGCEVTMLIADLHAFLDNMKSSLDQIQKRSEYYELILRGMLSFLEVEDTRLKFVRGTSFQLSSNYTMDSYRANSFITIDYAKKAGSEVVKQQEHPIMNSLIYPTLQALDEEYLQDDAQFGGVDQRKIFMHARTILPKLGYKKRFHLMSKMVSGIRFAKKEDVVEKMSASQENSKIDLLDTRNNIKKKINKAYCLAGDIEDNSLLELLESVIFPILVYKNIPFLINRKVQHGGKIVYENFIKVQEDFKNLVLHPDDLKLGITDALNLFNEPLRNIFQDKKKLIDSAYC